MTPSERTRDATALPLTSDVDVIEMHKIYSVLTGEPPALCKDGRSVLQRIVELFLIRRAPQPTGDVPTLEQALRTVDRTLERCGNCCHSFDHISGARSVIAAALSRSAPAVTPAVSEEDVDAIQVELRTMHRYPDKGEIRAVLIAASRHAAAPPFQQADPGGHA